MARSQKNQGRKGLRAKSGTDSYYKGRYYIAFYKEEDDDEYFYAGFNNVVEICKHNKMEVTKSNINMIHQALFKALYEKDEPYTKLIDGVRLKVYLIDMSEEIKENERREKLMKKFVNISSTITVEVYPDLNAVDTTNKDAPMADRLSAKPDWVHPILIRAGIHFYPAQIKNWKTIKTLQKQKLLNVAEEVDDISDEEMRLCEEMLKRIKKIENRQSVQNSQKRAEPKQEAKAEHKAEAKAEQPA